MFHARWARTFYDAARHIQFATSASCQRRLQAQCLSLVEMRQDCELETWCTRLVHWDLIDGELKQECGYTYGISGVFKGRFTTTDHKNRILYNPPGEGRRHIVDMSASLHSKRMRILVPDCQVAMRRHRAPDAEVLPISIVQVQELIDRVHTVEGVRDLRDLPHHARCQWCQWLGRTGKTDDWITCLLCETGYHDSCWRDGFFQTHREDNAENHSVCLGAAAAAVLKVIMAAEGFQGDGSKELALACDTLKQWPPLTFDLVCPCCFLLLQSYQTFLAEEEDAQEE